MSNASRAMSGAPILVTGAAGFIGANFVLEWVREMGTAVVSLDKLTYAGNRANLSGLQTDSRHTFVHGDIADRERVRELLERHRPAAIAHLAAESHVDRSIHGPEEFIHTNVQGTFVLLDEALRYYRGLTPAGQAAFRFLHVSTDEVYGSLGPEDPPFEETTAYAPNSPYSASKAASDHLARAYFHTFGLPVLTTNCTNNYGPFQFPEKLIPLMIHNALAGDALPIYGDGRNVRDWLYVTDHCAALRLVLAGGRPGEVYGIGGGQEMANLDVVAAICSILDELRPNAALKSYRALIRFVQDRPGHDRRYAMNTDKIRRELGWAPRESFASGLRKTVQWYLDHESWVNDVRTGAYRQWIEKQYGNEIASGRG